MKLIDGLAHVWKDEGFTKVRKYIRKPALITFIIAFPIVVIVILIFLLSGQLENLIVSLNLRYNSPMFIGMASAFLIIQVVAIGYGTFLSMRTYKRPGRKGIFKKTYAEGNSYQAIEKYLYGGHKQQ